ncbi:hypothetical protein HXX76_005630 [Chlamydomonas incerta]|uniref:THUMP domain-containing protein n=1 Tax=Chlamydomonas incerta TaxID=51695 RepID=A0A835T5X5_CHLIN|nr:hypothetical protein HXX76_005630 [Chlamydomonas incerta]|eukprot:KAG2438016.1 hypothetical protein HXX76_005630 [Chlamydomonas incerta]
MARPSKRPKPGDPATSGRRAAGTVPFVPVDRFRYAVVGELEAGAKGFIVTCNFRKEKSATREASQLLRRYMPAHLFPAPPQPAPTAPAEDPAQAQAQAQPGQGHSGAGATVQRPEPEGQEGAAAVEADEDVEDADDSQSEDESDAGNDQADGSAGAAGPAAAAAAASAGGGGAADAHHPEPSALGLAKVGCRGVVVMRLSSRAAAEVEPVRLLEGLLADLEAARAAPAAAKRQKQQQKQQGKGKGREQQGGGQGKEEAVGGEGKEQEQEEGKEQAPAGPPGTTTSPPLQQPKHCQRLVPLDATCALTRAGLSRAVADAAAAYRRRQVAGSGSAAEGPQQAAATQELQPFSYAVMYHSRDSEASAAAQAAAAPGAGEPAAAGGADGSGKLGEDGDGELADRGRIIECVAAAMRSAFGEAARVNLKKPDVAVVVEAMPVAGRRFAGVSLLGSHLFLAKGRLQVKPLVSNPPTQPKAGKGKAQS